jgi:hypothetical protein
VPAALRENELERCLPHRMTGDGQSKLIALLDDLEVEKLAAIVFGRSEIANALREL